MPVAALTFMSLAMADVVVLSDHSAILLTLWVADAECDNSLVSLGKVVS